MNKLIISGLLLLAATDVLASEAAWIFAHRVNSLAAVESAAYDQEVNAIEIDVSHRDDVPGAQNLPANLVCLPQW